MPSFFSDQRQAPKRFSKPPVGTVGAAPLSRSLMFSGLLGTALASCRSVAGLVPALASCGSDFCGSDFGFAATAVGAGLGDAVAGFDFGALISGLFGAAAGSSLFEPNRLLKKL